MKLIITLLVVIGCCSIMTEAFFSSKDKNKPCDPNPCKNNGQCVQDAVDKTKHKCLCTDKFHGDKCTDKTGCSKDPCPKGVPCTNDAKDKSKFHCKCPAGLLGDKCKIQDECPKTKCENGKCFNNEKNKPECECNPGWKLGFRGNCNHRNCTITEFVGKNFVHKNTPKFFIDPAIKHKFEKLDSLAKICGVKIRPERGFTFEIKDPKNKYHQTKPDMEPFYAGRGMKYTVCDKNDKLLCNEQCLGKFPVADKGAKCLVDGFKAIEWQYSTLKPGEIHDGSHYNFKEHEIIKESHQVGCVGSKVA